MRHLHRPIEPLWGTGVFKDSLSVNCTGALGSSACGVMAAAVVGCTGLLVEARTRDGARAITPDRPTAPNEGRNPVTPHWLAGEVMEPQVSVPMANGTMPAARADADPACHQPEHVPAGCPAPGAALLKGVLSDHKLEACVSQIPHAKHAILLCATVQHAAAAGAAHLGQCTWKGLDCASQGFSRLGLSGYPEANIPCSSLPAEDPEAPSSRFQGFLVKPPCHTS